MRITSQKPSALTATTSKVTIAGDIKNFEEAGCDISFTATGYLK